MPTSPILKPCLRDPIPEIFEAAELLSAAVDAHLANNAIEAAELIRHADIPAIREWTESLWGKQSPHVILHQIPNPPPYLPKEVRLPVRMPNAAERKILHQRDGYHCRFCGIPLIRKEVRQRIKSAYPKSLSWGKTNLSQHAAFQAMWLQYDHVVPHSRGGTNELDNLILTCAPCNFAKWHYLCEEIGLQDPRERSPLSSSWDGLERFQG